MKMYLKTLALCLISNSLAMEDNTKTIVVLGSAVNASITKLCGIVAQNANGYLECRVTHDSTNDKYTGTLINKGYSMAEWYIQSLDEQKAQKYYNKLTECLNK